MPPDALICHLMHKDESRKALILREICEIERILEMIKILFICHGTILTIEKNAVFTRVAEFL